MRSKMIFTAISISLVLIFTISPVNADDAKRFRFQGKKAKNIIFMVPDGMGLDYVTATRVFAGGPDGEPLNMEQLPQIGYQRTHSANSEVTDSAAAAGAWACGEKFNNGEISCHADAKGVCRKSPVTVLEVAKKIGKATGLVATATITHATPAAWAAHTNSRKCEAEIARQYIEVTGVDVLLGGGLGSNSSSAAYHCDQYTGQDKAAVIAEAQDRGYACVTTRDEMDKAVAGGQNKLLGLFSPNGKTPELYRVDSANAYPEGEPTLAEMTVAALDVLEEDRDGFFLMVEGSQIDWAGHANNKNYLLSEMLGFDEAVKKVQDWINAKPSRRRHTLLIIVADHETGGFAINGPNNRFDTKDGTGIEDGWTSGDHTAGDTIIWSQGPGSDKLGKPVDNTDLFKVMVNVLR